MSTYSCWDFECHRNYSSVARSDTNSMSEAPFDYDSNIYSFLSTQHDEDTNEAAVSKEKNGKSSRASKI